MNTKSNRQLRKLLYLIVLAGMVLGPAFWMDGSRIAHAQPAAPSSNPVFLPLVLRAPAYQTLTVNMLGSGSGTVTSLPPGIDCTSSCSAAFNFNTSVTLAAVAGADSVFAGWSGSGCSGSDTCTVNMDNSQAVTATFTNAFVLRIALSGTGSGRVTSLPAGINCGSICSYSFAENTVVTLTATPDTSSTFAGWTSGDCSGKGTCQVTMDGGRQALAAFNLSCRGIGNCDFEAGPDGQWTEYPSKGYLITDCSYSNGLFCNSVLPHSGKYLAWLGGEPGENYIQQQISVTNQAHHLVYWHWIDAYNSCATNYAEVWINTTRVNTYGLCPATNTETWATHSIDLSLYEGQTVTLKIHSVIVNNYNTSLYIDDVSLQAGP